MPDSSSGLPRVLFAVGGLSRGGSENQLLELIAQTHGRDLDATLMTFATDDPPEREAAVAELGVRHVRVPAFGVPRAVRPLFALPRIARHVRAVQPDVIYPWLEAPATALAPVARAHRIPLIVARRNVCGANVERFAPVRYAIRAAERSATLVTGNSEAVLDEARARGVPTDRLRLVRNGHVVRPRLPLVDSEPVVIGYVANFRGEKGHRRLLSAVAGVRAATPWRVDLAGEGELRGAVAQEIRRRGLDERVRMVGGISDAREFWRRRHIAALLSDNEGSPNALIEAALCGRPLIGTRAGGTGELISKEGGILVPSEDEEAIARAFKCLIDDAELRARLSEGAFELAAREHDVRAFVDGHVSAIREAIRRPA